MLSTERRCDTRGPRYLCPFVSIRGSRKPAPIDSISQQLAKNRFPRTGQHATKTSVHRSTPPNSQLLATVFYRQLPAPVLDQDESEEHPAEMGEVSDSRLRTGDTGE